VRLPFRDTIEPTSPNALRHRGSESGRALAGRVLRSRELIYVLVGLGLLLRVVQYASNRSLWNDEALLALNLIEKRVTDLAGPLDFDQAAPVGFLLTEGIVTRVLGFSEYALRLFPLVCGLLSVPAFVWLARRTLARAAAPLAILLFVVADALVYYSSELKPYETDVAASLGLLIAGVFLAEHAARLTATSALALALVSFGLIALSFPAAFIVAAVTATMVTSFALRGRRSFTVPSAAVVIFWAIASIGIASFAAANIGSVRERLVVGSGSFLGIPGHASVLHAVNVMGTQIAGAIGLPQERPFNHIEKLALLCAIVGALGLLWRKPGYFSMIVLPFPLLLGASALNAYPILQRTELFLIPPTLLLIAEGVYQIVRQVPNRAQIVAAALLAAVIAAGPVWGAGKHVVEPRTHEEIRPVLEFVRDHWHRGDTLYVHYGAQYALLYYEECKCLRLSLPPSRRSLWPLKPVHVVSRQYPQAAIPLTRHVILGKHFSEATPNLYLRDLDRVEGGRRVWFLYSHLNQGGEQVLVEAMLRRMESLGKRIDGIDRPRAHAYLYRLRNRDRR
jgi:hypothetical protein